MIGHKRLKWAIEEIAIAKSRRSIQEIQDPESAAGEFTERA
jgi:hypothetical protein